MSVTALKKRHMSFNQVWRENTIKWSPSSDLICSDDGTSSWVCKARYHLCFISQWALHGLKSSGSWSGPSSLGKQGNSQTKPQHIRRTGKKQKTKRKFKDRSDSSRWENGDHKNVTKSCKHGRLLSSYQLGKFRSTPCQDPTPALLCSWLQHWPRFLHKDDSVRACSHARM